MTHNATPMPDIEILAPNMTTAQLKRHYGCSFQAVRRRLVKLGLEPRRLTTKERSAQGKLAYTPIIRIRPTPDNADMAADFLRRDYAVWRCNEDGEADYTGRLYRVGRQVLTSEALIEKARGKGWRP